LGAGKHGCVGNAFGLWLLPAFLSVIRGDFVLAGVQPLDSYADDVTKMVIQLAQPARVRYRRRDRSGSR
jgi:sterol 14-demethylase